MSSHSKAVVEIALSVDPKAEIKLTSGSHIRVKMTGPLGTRVVVASKTPSDQRAVMNIRGDIRRAGREIGLIK